jgi:hypothetical protein
MLRIKLAATLMMPLAFFCSIASAQESGKTLTQKTEGTDVIPSTDCTTKPGEVYGPYVPYTGPALPPGCHAPNAPVVQGSTPQPNSSAAHPSQPEINSVAQPSLGLNGTSHPATDLILATDSKPSDPDPSGGSGYVRPVPTIPAPRMLPDLKPFRTYAFGFKADTLGLGFEIATPLALRINLRSSFNIFAFDDPFNIDGVNYDARLHLKSSETTVDWFPRATGGFHISPGLLYLKNTMSAPASVGPGQTFVLGTQTFLNSIDDPMTGTSSVVYPHTFAPMLLLGFGNIIPRTYRHISFPVEFGAAYTGAPQISVALNGTACTTEGCVNFAGNAQAQTFLKQEVYNLNEDLKRYPVFPIVSLGVAYRF